MTSRLDRDFLEYLDGATHIQIRCISPSYCGRTVYRLTSEIVALLPRARTVREFQDRMICQRCHCRGNCDISPARR